MSAYLHNKVGWNKIGYHIYDNKGGWNNTFLFPLYTYGYVYNKGGWNYIPYNFYYNKGGRNNMCNYSYLMGCEHGGKTGPHFSADPYIPHHGCIQEHYKIYIYVQLPPLLPGLPP